MIKASGEERIYLAPTCMDNCSLSKKSEQELKHQAVQEPECRRWCRGHGGNCLLTWLSWLAQPAFLIEPRATSPRMATPTLRKCPTCLPMTQYYGCIFLIRIPFSQMALVCVKVIWNCPAQVERNSASFISKTKKIFIRLKKAQENSFDMFVTG